MPFEGGWICFAEMSGVALVSRSSPVQPAGSTSKRCGNARTMIPAGKVERSERKRTASEVSKADWAMSKPEVEASDAVACV